MNIPRLDFEKGIAELVEQIERLQELARGRGLEMTSESAVLEEKLEELKRDGYSNHSPVDRGRQAGHPKRRYSLDYIERVFTDFIQLHGDRSFRDDAAIVGGWARLEGETVMVIGHQKGRDMKENLRRNFGMPHPEGYRKALRLMRRAEKFGHPIKIG